MKYIAKHSRGARLAVVFGLSLGMLARPAPAQDTVVRIAEDEAKKLAINKVNPEYPAMAKQMRLSGKVQVDCVIDTDGGVEQVKVVNGNPLL